MQIQEASYYCMDQLPVDEMLPSQSNDAQLRTSMWLIVILLQLYNIRLKLQMGNEAHRLSNSHLKNPKQRASYSSSISRPREQNLHSDSFVIKKSSSFYSTATYPNFEEFEERKQSLIPKSQGERLDHSKVEAFPYSTVGFIAYENTRGEKNYSTGFLITSCLVLTAANPTLVRNERDGTICEYRPTAFLLGQGLNIRIYEIVDFRRPSEYTQLMTSENSQDYVHSSIKSRISSLIKAETYDYCLLKLKQNIANTQYLNLLGDYDGYGENRIIGYNYDDEYDDLSEQDKEMVIGQYVYTNGYVCEEEKARMDINVRKTVVGGPIIVKYDKKIVVIGILIRSSIHKELSAGLLINNAKIEMIRNWIIEMNQFPKCLIFRQRRGSNDEGSSRKDSEEVHAFSEKEIKMKFRSEVSPPKTVKSEILIKAQSEENSEFWSKDNINNSKFEITNTRVKKTKYNGEIHQVVSKNPVNTERRSSCKIRLVQYGGKYAISIGLINQNRINKRYSGDYNQNESIGFWTFNYGRGKGRMFVGGESVRGWDQSLFVSEGGHLLIKINNEDSTTQWWINEREVAKYELPECLKNKDLYLYVAMERKNDCVEYVK